MTNDVSLLAELAALRARVDTLEAERAQAKLTRERRRRWVLSCLTAALAFATTFVWAADGACPNGYPFCLVADEPARASDVNHNFAQIREWLEQKTGAVGSAEVRVQTGATSNVTAASGKALFVSGTMGDGLSGNGGVEFRHDNLTQGVGIGFNTVYATGSAANQDLNLRARGTGVVRTNSPTHLGNTSVFGALSTTGALTVGGDLVSNSNQHGNCYDTAYGCGYVTCAGGYFMAGLDIAENEVCGGQGDFDYSEFSLRCCRL